MDTTTTLRLVDRRRRQDGTCAPNGGRTLNFTVRPDARLLLSVEDAAARLDIGRTLLYELIAARQIQTIHVRRLHKVPVESLREFVERRIDAALARRRRTIPICAPNIARFPRQTRRVVLDAGLLSPCRSCLPLPSNAFCRDCWRYAAECAAWFRIAGGREWRSAVLRRGAAISFAARALPCSRMDCPDGRARADPQVPRDLSPLRRAVARGRARPMVDRNEGDDLHPLRAAVTHARTFDAAAPRVEIAADTGRTRRGQPSAPNWLRSQFAVAAPVRVPRTGSGARVGDRTCLGGPSRLMADP